MCDFTGFVILAPISHPTAASLAECLMQHVLLQVGFCLLLNVDDDSKFKGLFKEACDHLGLRFNPAAKGNHKAVSVERFFRYLNKAVTIASEDRDTLDVWIPASMIAGFAWNSSPIDGTDIIRSVAAVGREFRLPVDVKLSTIDPSTLDLSAQALSTYMTCISRYSSFAQNILALLIADRRAAHAERINETRNPIAYNVGDLVLARVQVQSDASRGRVAKLTYRIRGPFEIVARLDGGSYHIRRAGAPNSPLLKFHAECLQPVPPGLLPCEPIDTADFRYLNLDHGPKPHPLQHLGIQHYNAVWFDPNSPKPPPKFQYSSDAPFPIDKVADSPFESLADLNSCDQSCIVPSVSAPIPSPSSTSNPSNLLQRIQSSTDKLFFIAYHAPGTFRPRWYLVQVDLDSTARHPDCPNFASTGRYYVHFFARHPDDFQLSDLCSRWWPEWHRYTRNADGIIDYGERHPLPTD
jgi:hypothetical protein